MSPYSLMSIIILYFSWIIVIKETAPVNGNSLADLLLLQTRRGLQQVQDFCVGTSQKWSKTFAHILPYVSGSQNFSTEY